MRRGLVLVLALLLGVPVAWADPDLWMHDIDGHLGTLDVATGVYDDVGVTREGTIEVVLADIAFAPDGRLYGISYETQASVSSVLYRIDTATAALTRVARTDVGRPVNALVFSRTGTLLAAGGNDLVSLDPATGASTPLLRFAPNISAGDLAFDASGNLYLTVISTSASGRPTNLIRLDVAGATWSLVGAIGSRDVYGLAFGPDGVMYGVSDFDRQVFPIDLASGAGGTPVPFAAPGPSGALGASFPTEAVGPPPPAGCAVAATFSSILCRVSELAAATDGTDALGAIGGQKAQLVRVATRAGTRATRGRDRCGDTAARNAARKAGAELRTAAKQLSIYRTILRAARARKKLPADVRAAFLARVEPLIADAKTLRKALDCPADASR